MCAGERKKKRQRSIIKQGDDNFGVVTVIHCLASFSNELEKKDRGKGKRKRKGSE